MYLAGLLTYLFPFGRLPKDFYIFSDTECPGSTRITAAGTVTGSHGIPYYALLRVDEGHAPIQRQR